MLLSYVRVLSVSPEVVGFYGHNKGEFSCFSNFYDQSKEPFDFEVPQEFFAPGIEEGGLSQFRGQALRQSYTSKGI